MFGTFLMSRSVATSDVYMASLMVVLIVFPYIFMQSANIEYIYMASSCVEQTWKILFPYISRGDRTLSWNAWISLLLIWVIILIRK